MNKIKEFILGFIVGPSAIKKVARKLLNLAGGGLIGFGVEPTVVHNAEPSMEALIIGVLGVIVSLCSSYLTEKRKD